jgi:hypothetical protein
MALDGLDRHDSGSAIRRRPRCTPPTVTGDLIVVPFEQPRHRQKLSNDNDRGDGGENLREPAVPVPPDPNARGLVNG